MNYNQFEAVGFTLTFLSYCYLKSAGASVARSSIVVCEINDAIGLTRGPVNKPPLIEFCAFEPHLVAVFRTLQSLERETVLFCFSYGSALCTGSLDLHS